MLTIYLIFSITSSATHATEKISQTQDESALTHTCEVPQNSIAHQSDADPILSSKISEGPLQPLLKEFPLKFGRRFSLKLYDQFPWLEYDIVSNSVFCFCCRHFGKEKIHKGETKGRRTFIDVGFSKYKDISALCKQHQISDRHITCQIKWDHFRAVEANDNPSIINSLRKASVNEIKENRNHMKIIFEVTSLLGRQQLAFRGHDESNSSMNQGNFKETLLTIGNILPSVRARLEHKYGVYSNPSDINDVIMIFGSSIRDDVAKQVKQAEYFSVLADETKDCSKKEQLSIFLRYFDGKKIFERSIGSNENIDG